MEEDLIVPIGGGSLAAIYWLASYLRESKAIPDLGSLMIVFAAGMGLLTAPFVAIRIHRLHEIEMGDKKFLYAGVCALIWVTAKHLKDEFFPGQRHS